MIDKLSALFYTSRSDNEWTLSKKHVAWLLLGIVALWTILCSISHSAPDLDGMEELVWASSFELGYFKHPPLPTWLMYGLTSIFGKPVWLAFFAGQMVSALALWFIWLLGCEFTTPKKALIATLMVSTTMYFSIRGTIYNHNTAQLWSIAASTWLFYRALRYQKTASWVWLGIVGGLAIMTKYSAAIQFFAFFVFLATHGHFREKSTVKGIGTAFFAFAITVSPHVYWLVSHSFSSFSYAEDSIESPETLLNTLIELFVFSYNQLGRISPMLIAWLVLYYWNKKSNKRQANVVAKHAFAVETPGTYGATLSTEKNDAGRNSAFFPQSYAQELSRWDRSFLLWVGLTPFISTVLVAAILEIELVTSWATTFFILYGFYAFWWLSGNEHTNLRRTLVVAILIHMLLAVGYATARGPLAYYAGRPARSTFPGPAVSAEMNKVWQSHVTDVPLRLVASDRWLGGNIAIHTSPKTNVFIDARYNESPWLNQDTALDCGVLIAYSETTLDAPVPEITKLLEHAVWKGVAKVPWSTPASPIIVINWGIIPPRPQCHLSDSKKLTEN